MSTMTEAEAVNEAIRIAGEGLTDPFYNRKGIARLLLAAVSTPGGRQLLARRLTGVLVDQVGLQWAMGWQPGDLYAVAGRHLDRAGAALVAGAVRLEASQYAPSTLDPRWAAQLDSFDGDERTLDPDGPTWLQDVASAVGPLPGQGSSRAAQPHGDGRILAKVRALLAKAESTTFPDEADALTAKAQQMMATHNLDRAALHSSGPAGEMIAGVRRIWIDKPYLSAKATLLHAVADANRCRSVFSAGLGVATVAGHDDDLDTVEVLFTSLLVQATVRMAASGARVDRAGRSRTRSFRQSFLIAYASRIAERLREAAEAAESAAMGQHGAGLVPVLASRRSAAEETINTMFRRLRHTRHSVTDPAGWAAGTAAADLASLNAQQELADSACK
jgi:hypothetical protein